MTFDGCSRRHDRADQVRSPPLALTSFEVPVRSGSASFTWLENIRVHPETHQATGLAPIETSFFEDPIQAFVLRRPLYLLRAGHHHGIDAWRNPLTFNELRDHTQIFQAGVRTRADKDPLH